MGYALPIDENWRGERYMPLKLKSILIRNGIPQAELCRAVKQQNGQLMSGTAMSQLMNRQTWPKTTSAKSICSQVEAFLRLRGVSEDEIGLIWQTASKEEQNNVFPIGIHRVKETVRDELDIQLMEVQVLTPAAKRHFKLFRDPFAYDINGPEDVFLSSDQRYIREAMYQTARHGGFLAVVGESGAGKSVLRRDLIDRIAREGLSIRVIFPRCLDKSRLTTASICEAIIQDLQPGSKVPRSLEAQARRVEKLLLDSSRAENTHVLMIEEAHDLSIATLKYLKRFHELEDGYHKLLSIVLVGQPELKDRLDERKNPDAREIIRRCEVAELLPLGEHLSAYVAHKFKRIDVNATSVIADDACEAIRTRLERTHPGTRETFSQVYPLVVNNALTRAMNRAAELGVPVVTADLIKEL